MPLVNSYKCCANSVKLMKMLKKLVLENSVLKKSISNRLCVKKIEILTNGYFWPHHQVWPVVYLCYTNINIIN